MKSLIFALLCSTATAAFADGIVGVYNGTSPTRHYGQTTIRPRGPDYLLNSCGAYSSPNGGSNCLPIVAIIRETRPGFFETVSGSITGYYGNIACSYPVRISVQQDTGRIFLSEFGPGNFPPSYGCPSQDRMNYSSFIEPDAYLLIAPSIR